MMLLAFSTFLLSLAGFNWHREWFSGGACGLVLIVLFRVFALMEDSDPHLCAEELIDVQDGKNVRQTPIKLRNISGAVAHQVEIQPIKLQAGTATFETIDMLRVGETAEAKPTIIGAKYELRHDLPNLLRLEIQAREQSSSHDFVLPMRVVYKKYPTTKTFECSFDLKWSPVKDGLHRRGFAISTKNCRLQWTAKIARVLGHE